MAQEKHLFHPKNLAFVCRQYSITCRRLQLVGAIIDRPRAVHNRPCIPYISKEHPCGVLLLLSCKCCVTERIGRLRPLAAAAAVVAAVIVGVAAAIATAIAAATAIAEDQQQNDDPPPVVPTEAAAQTVIVAHKITSGFNR